MKKLILFVSLFLSIGALNAQCVTDWKINYYVDEFGDPDPTTGGYISGIVKGGKFSNSATTNSNLSIVIYSEQYKKGQSIGLKLAEYDNNIVKAYTNTFYTVKIKDSKDYIHTFKMVMLEGANTMYNSGGEIHDLFMNNDVLKFSIKEMKKGYTSSYSFKVNTNDYKELFNKL